MRRWTKDCQLADTRRADLRDIAITAVAVVLVLALVAWVAREEMATPEVTLRPVTVEMSDPYPCQSDPEIRLLYRELGVLCRGLDQ